MKTATLHRSDFVNIMQPTKTNNIYSYVLTQEAGDCDFFQWADNKMTAYEKKLEERMKDLEEGR
jgi:hypothetical protein